MIKAWLSGVCIMTAAKGSTRMGVLQVMREDKLLVGCQRYIGDSLGAAFTQGQPWTLDGMLPDTSALTPIIFILTSGADPTAMLQVDLIIIIIKTLSSSMS